MISVIVADDQAVIREGIKCIIEQDSDIIVVGIAANGYEAFELCGKLSPDLVLMDIVMPECDGAEGTRLIKARYSKVKVLILTTFCDDECISRALKNGADGYVLKDIRPEELIYTIKSTVGGLKVIHQNVFDNILRQYAAETCVAGNSSTHEELSESEKKIVQLIVFGKNNREIASSIHLSEGRVRNIITTILQKLYLKDRTQLAVYAVKNNLV